MKFEWEIIDANGYTARAKVVGGWVLCHTAHEWGETEKSISESMVFIPDKEHQWEITK